MSAGINKGLSFYFWNIRSLLPKIDSVREYVDSTRPNILCLSETWLKQEIPSTLIHLDDYILIREDRKTINDEGYIKRGGGLCTYVKSSIKVEQLHLDPGIPANGDIEVIVHRILLPHTSPIFLLNIYRPPQGNIDNFIDKLQTIVNTLPRRRNDITDEKEIIIGGDININIAHPNHVATKKFKTFMRLNTMKQFINQPTRPVTNDAILDLIVSNSQHIVRAGTMDINVSDHIPTFIIRKKTKLNFDKCKFVGRSYRNFDSVIFETRLKESNWEFMYGLHDIDNIWEFFQKQIRDNLDKLCPSKDFQFAKERPPWLSNELIEYIKDRDAALRKAATSKTEEDRRIARNLRNFTNRLVKTAKADYIKAQLELYRGDSKKFWQTIKTVIPKENSNKVIKLKDGSGQHMSDSEAAEYVNSYFASIGTLLADRIPEARGNFQTPLTIHENGSSFSLRPITLQELHDEIKKHTNL